jgi:tetratricopeptide (TPR) repeat protein
MDDGQPPGQAAMLAHLQPLYMLGHFSEVVRVASETEELANVPEAQLLAARALMEQGNFRAAEAAFAVAHTVAGPESITGYEISLWSAFLRLYRWGDTTIFEEVCSGSLFWARAEPGRDRIVAIALDLQARALAISTEWGHGSSETLLLAQQQLSDAADVYRRTGDTDRAIAASLLRGHLLLKGKAPDRPTARAIIEEAYASATSAANEVRQAEAVLRLAELELEQQLRRPVRDEADTVQLERFQQALELYGQSEHAFGQADVLYSLGRLLTVAGFDGATDLQRALEHYQHLGHATGCYNTLSALALWHIRQGNLSSAWSYLQQSNTLVEKTGYLPGQQAVALGMGDYFFRAGQYARALSAYERAADLARHPVGQALVQINLANTYLLMGLAHRAENECQAAIERLRKLNQQEHLSLAYFILGNILSAREDWEGAKAAWHAGLAIDEQLGNPVSKAEKLISMAQALGMRGYQRGGSALPQDRYDEAMALYDQAIAVLASRGDPIAAAVVANAHQLRGQTAIRAGRIEDAADELGQARALYESLKMGMQLATTDMMLGLLYYDVAGRGLSHLNEVAGRHFEQALSYYVPTNMRDMSWKTRRFLALTRFRQGVFAVTSEEQRTHWVEASRLLEEADADINLIRGSFITTDQTLTDEARLAIVADKDAVYTFAVHLQQHYLRDVAEAFTWLERLKGRVFLDALAVTPLRLPSINEALVVEEQALLAARRHAVSQAEVVALSDSLQTIWSRMGAEPTAAEYVAR